MKKISRRNFLQLAGVSTAAAAFAACSSDSSTTSTTSTTSTDTSSDSSSEDSSVGSEVGTAPGLTAGWWGTESVHEYTIAAGDYYTEQTGIPIESTYLSWADYWDKMTVLAASGELVDIMRQDFSMLSQYAGNGLLAPLDEYIESGFIDTTNVDSSLLDGGYVNGSLYAINVGSNALCCICNTELIEGAGMTPPDETFTFDEFEAWQLEFTEKTGKYATTLQFYANSTPMFESELRSAGKLLFKDGALNFEAADLQSYLERAKRLQDGGAIPNIELLSQELNAEDSQFTKDNAALDAIWSDSVAAVVTVLDKPCTLTIIPGTGPTKGVYIKPSQLLAIPAKCEYKDDAANYINMWTNDSGFNAVLAGRRGMPINSEIADEVKQDLDANNQMVYDYIEFAMDYAQSITSPWPMGSSEVVTAFKTAVAETLYGESSAADAAEKFMTNAAQILIDAQA